MTRIILTRFLAIFSKMLGPFIWHSDLFKIKPKTQAPVSVTCLNIHVSAACGKRLVMMFLYKKIPIIVFTNQLFSFFPLSNDTTSNIFQLNVQLIFLWVSILRIIGWMGVFGFRYFYKITEENCFKTHFIEFKSVYKRHSILQL